MGESHDERSRSAEERALRDFKDSLSYETVAVLDTIFGDGADEQAKAREQVRAAYARVWEFRPGELDPEETTHTAPDILRSLRGGASGTHTIDPPGRQALVHVLAELDYYFFEVSCGKDRVFDMPELADEERAAEHGVRHDLMLAIYDELEPAFDVSLSWPPNGYELNEKGELIGFEAELSGAAAIGYDHGHELAVFYEGSAAEGEYVRGFVEGRLERIGEEDPEDAAFMREVWEDEREEALQILKDGVEIREGRFDDRPEFPA